METELSLSNNHDNLNCCDYLVEQSTKILELKDIFKQKIKILEAEVFYQYGIVTGNSYLLLLFISLIFFIINSLVLFNVVVFLLVVVVVVVVVTTISILLFLLFVVRISIASTDRDSCFNFLISILYVY